MPNSFGAPGSLVPLYDPQLVRANREWYRRDLFPELDRANSFIEVTGRWPSQGWLLLKRGDYNAIKPYATNLQLQIDDGINKALTFSGLSIVQARCVTRGVAADPLAIYLVQITDTQGVLYNPWFQFPTTSQYNVRAPAYDGQYYSSTTNGGTPWTWDTMVGDLWNQMGAFLGAYPHLPITPAGTPENFIFVGQPAWEAINQIMDYLGLVITSDATKTSPYSIVQAGGTDATFTSLQAKYINQLEDDMEYLDAGSGRVPGQLTVLFHRRNQFYGTEETVRNDALQWQATPFYSVTVPAPATFTNAAGTGYLWAEFTVRYDVNGNPLAADVATAAVIAAERAQQWYNKIYRGTSGFMRQVYTGVLPFFAGAQVDCVRWFQTTKLGETDEDRAGWRTEIIRGYIPDEVLFPLTLQGLTGPT